MTRLKAFANPTKDGKRFTFQVFGSRLTPKLSIDGSHWLIADGKTTTGVSINGEDRDAVVMLKIWAPVPRRQRRREKLRMAEERLRDNSPVLVANG